MKNESSGGLQKIIPDPGSAKERRAVEKAPAEQKGKGEKLSEKDLKGKKIDSDPSREEGRPAS